MNAIPLQAAPGKTGIQFELAAESDETELRSLLRDQAMDGEVRIAMVREPDYFASLIVNGDPGRHSVFVGRDSRTSRLMMMGSRSVQNVFLGGRVARLGYLSQLRAITGFPWRRDTLLSGYAFAIHHRRADEPGFDLTSIMADNVRARRLLERGIPGMPRYSRITGMNTLVLPARTRKSDDDGVRRSGTSDLPQIAGFLQRCLRPYELAPVWSPERLQALVEAQALQSEDFLILENGGEITGCAAVWDQRGFRQTLVQGYAPGIERWRPLINLYLRSTGRPALPPAGSTLNAAYLSHLAVADADHAAVSRLVAAARGEAARRGIDLLLLGLCDNDPALGTLCRTRGVRAYRSVLYFVEDAHSQSHPIIDPGKIRVELATL